MSGKTCSTVNRIYSKALERGFEPNVLPVCLKLEHLQDGPRSGRPVMADQHIQEAVINKAKEVHSERALNLNAISEGLSLDGLKIGKTTIWRILKDSGFKKKKARELFQ
ncbi:hypothetical protein CONCODRAFT_77460 [Conidiobolus coronatus NRRL 28638]|uniref:Transposase Tc1-like domain-containing protein n=1 Tax=Conidiobolus coronatus (strain ATCC 28846 / CBS 209.66 / NRRL 28638) TaxID=796925 RepID=A0A137PE34_CONC2|nr:hypothetical protein CONCODRAFT_77460 [Conidiobolus coronatus NRRL 28638]|eukprot:KXN73268.1 hypothetical protein CONCODRAFT_77460 [Conidiobolus coronatus NRRL 28638]